VAFVPDALFRTTSSLESPARIGFIVAADAPGVLDAEAPSVVLDRIQDPGNAGSILRSAAAFGFTQVLALVGTVSLWSPKVLRAAMGAHFALHIRESLTIDDLAAYRSPLLATQPHAGDELGRTPLPWPCGWVLGHEGQGVSPGLAARCARVLRIAQSGGQESLNAAAAAAVCLHESQRMRSGVAQ
jgi:TrmH family RNA methyltransferase